MGQKSSVKSEGRSAGSSCEVLGHSLSLSEPQVLICKEGAIIILSHSIVEKIK